MADSMTEIILIHKGTSIPLSLPLSTTTVLTLKSTLSPLLTPPTPPSHIRLICLGKLLQDDMTCITALPASQDGSFPKLQVFTRPLSHTRPPAQARTAALNNDVDTLCSVTGHCRASAAMALAQASGDVTGAADLLFRRMDELMEEKVADIMATGGSALSDVSEGLKEDEEEMEMVREAIEREMTAKQAEQAEQGRQDHGMNDFKRDLMALAVTQTNDAPLEATPAEEEERVLQLAPEPEPQVKPPPTPPQPPVEPPAEEAVDEEKKEEAAPLSSPVAPVAPVAPIAHSEAPPTSTLASLLLEEADVADLVTDTLAAAPSPTPSPAHEAPDPEARFKETLAAMFRTSALTYMKRVNSKDLHVPTLKNYDPSKPPPPKQTASANPLLHSALVGEADRIHSQLEATLGQESVSLSDITQSGAQKNGVTFHVRSRMHRGAPVCLRTVKCYWNAGDDGNALLLESIVKEIRVHALVAYSKSNVFEDGQHHGHHGGAARQRSTNVHMPSRKRSTAAEESGEKTFFGEGFEGEKHGRKRSVSLKRKKSAAPAGLDAEGHDAGIPTSITVSSPSHDRRLSNVFGLASAKNAALALSPKKKEPQPAAAHRASNVFGAVAAHNAAAHLSPKRNSLLCNDGKDGKRRSMTPKNAQSGGAAKHKYLPSEHKYCLPIIGYSLRFDPHEQINKHDHMDQASPLPSDSAQPHLNLSIVTDYCDNKVLSQSYALPGRLKEYDVLRWVSQVCMAVKHMHGVKVVHGGLRSDVVQLTSGGFSYEKIVMDACVTDFRVAREVHANKLSPTKGAEDSAEDGPDGTYDCQHIPRDNYIAPEINDALSSTTPSTNKILPYKVDVWGIGCLLFELLTKKSLKESDKPMYEMEGEAISKVPTRFGDIVKHILRRCLHTKTKQRASVDEIFDVLGQHLAILDNQEKEQMKKKGVQVSGDKEVEEVKLSQKELIELAKKQKAARAQDEPSLSGSHHLDDDRSLSTTESKVQQKLQEQIDAAKRIAAEEGWEKTKDRVADTLRRRWWNALTDRERFICNWRKQARRENMIKASRRKLSKKAALVKWWSTKFIISYMSIIMEKMEENGVIQRIRDERYDIPVKQMGTVQRKNKDANDESTQGDDSTVFSAKSVASSSINSHKLAAKVSVTSMETGLLDKMITFQLGIPLFEGYHRHMDVKNGAFFPIPLEDPNIKQRAKEKADLERKKQLGLVGEDGEETAEMAEKRKKHMAKKRWTNAGAKIKLTAMLMGGIGMAVKQANDDEDDGTEAAKSKRSLNIEESESAEGRDKPVANHLFGCSYNDSLAEALTWQNLNGRKLSELIDEAEVEAEEIMERMREQSLLTDVSEQTLVRNNVIAKVFGKLEFVDKILERCIRTCEMPKIPGSDDESKWHTMTKMASVSQIKESMVDEEGNMKFKKLDMLGQKQVLAFVLQRSWDKLLTVVREGEFNAASSIQGRARGMIARALLKKVVTEAARQVKELLEGEERKKYESKKGKLVQSLEGWSKVKLVEVGLDFVEVRLNDALLELGRGVGKMGFKVISVVREDTEEGSQGKMMPCSGEIVLYVSMVVASREDGEAGVFSGDEGCRVEGLTPNKAYSVRMEWGNARMWDECREGMARRRQKLVEAIRGEREAEIAEKVAAAVEVARKMVEGLHSEDKGGDMMAAMKIAGEIVEAQEEIEKEIRKEVTGKWDKGGFDGPMLLEVGGKEQEWELLAKLKWMAGSDFDASAVRECWTKPDVPAKVGGLKGDYVWIMVRVEEEGTGGKDWRAGGGRKKKGGLLELGGNRRVPRVVVRWKEPRNNGWGIVHYKVERRVGGEEDGGEGWEVAGKSKVEEYVDVVERGIGRGGLELEYRVTAVNKLGAGGKSDVQYVRVETMGGLGSLGGEEEEEEEEEEEDFGGEGLPEFKVLEAPVDFVGGTVMCLTGMDPRKLQKGKRRIVKRK